MQRPTRARVPGRLILQVREFAQASQDEAAELARVSRASWSRWERYGAPADRWLAVLGFAVAYGGAGAIAVVMREWGEG